MQSRYHSLINFNNSFWVFTTNKANKKDKEEVKAPKDPIEIEIRMYNRQKQWITINFRIW